MVSILLYSAGLQQRAGLLSLYLRACVCALCCSADSRINRLFPFGVTVGALLYVFLILEILLIIGRRLVPGVMILGSIILLVLFITGSIATGIQLFGNDANVNGNCDRFVDNDEQRGVSVNTLAWLEQDSICECCVIPYV